MGWGGLAMRSSTHNDADIQSLERDRDIRGLIRVVSDLSGRVRPSDAATATLWQADDALRRVVQRMGDAAVAPLAKELRHRGHRAEIAAEVMWLTRSRLAIAPLERSAYSPFRRSRFTLRASQSLKLLRTVFPQAKATLPPSATGQPLAPVPPASSGLSLPPIAATELPSEFSPPKQVAAGGDLLQKAVEAWHTEDWDQADALFTQALEDGLTPALASQAHECLGEICLRRGELAAGVEQLVRCLSMRPISARVAWNAAVRLQVVYDHAGRGDEAARLRRVVSAARPRGAMLSSDAEASLRDLVRRAGLARR
jgi:hypothetical protein